MKKIFGLIALLVSSSAVLTMPAVAHERNDYAYSGRNGERSGSYSYSYSDSYRTARHHHRRFERNRDVRERRSY